jgi:hypothetical protein
MSYSNDFKRFEFDFKFAKSSKYVSLSKKDFVAIFHYINLPNELQVIFFSLLCVPAQITVKLIKLITTTNVPISYKKLAQELSVDENLIKLRLSNLYESGFPIELTEINVRMKTQPEAENEVKRLSR